MPLQYEDVHTEKTTVTVSTVVRIVFKIIGAMPVPFQFPFSNESLTENEIEFSKEDLNYGNSD